MPQWLWLPVRGCYGVLSAIFWYWYGCHALDHQCRNLPTPRQVRRWPHRNTYTSLMILNYPDDGGVWDAMIRSTGRWLIVWPRV